MDWYEHFLVCPGVALMVSGLLCAVCFPVYLVAGYIYRDPIIMASLPTWLSP